MAANRGCHAFDYQVSQGKTIPVAVYMNPQGAEQYKRITGAMDVLNADGRFSLIQEYAANGEAACLAQTETLLTDRPDVEVILTQIDNDVTGAVMALMDKDGVYGPVQGSSFIEHKHVRAGAGGVDPASGWGRETGRSDRV